MMMVNPIYGFYHVAVMGCWREIFIEQVRLLQTSGLLEATRKVYIGVVGAPTTEELSLIQVCPKSEILFVDPDVSKREFVTLSSIKDICNHFDGKLWYIHTKGASWPESGPLNDFVPERPFCEVLVNVQKWRRYMEHFVIERYKDCNQAIIDHDVCGVDFNARWGFQGNFWWAKADYIRKLARPEDLDAYNYHKMPRKFCIEYWIASDPSVKVKSFFNTRRVLYNHPVERAEYDQNYCMFNNV